MDSASNDTYILDRLECWIWALGFGCWMRLMFLVLVKIFGAVPFYIYISLTIGLNFTKFVWMVCLIILVNLTGWYAVSEPDFKCWMRLLLSKLVKILEQVHSDVLILLIIGSNLLNLHGWCVLWYLCFAQAWMLNLNLRF